MKGMTNNQIIMSEAAKLDPATLHAIATAHHTPEQIAAMAANAVTTDENGDEQPATIADVEIILAAAELHTFDHWKKEGKSVKKGETHLIECYLWKYTTRPSKAQREAAEAEGKEAAPAPNFYPTKSHLFSCLQVHDAKQAPAGRFGSVAAIMEYNKKLAAERKAAKAAAEQTATVISRKHSKNCLFSLIYFNRKFLSGKSKEYTNEQASTTYDNSSNNNSCNIHCLSLLYQS